MDISHNMTTNNGSNEIASVVINNPLLEHLNLANCDLSELQLISIFKALTKTSLLTFWDISHNKVTREAANEIATVIVNNQSLQYLNVSACDIQGDVEMIAVSLSYATSLVSLDVSCNNKLQEGVTQCIVMSLVNCIYLTNLNLQSCCLISLSTVEFLCNIIAQNKSLQYLNFN